LPTNKSKKGLFKKGIRQNRDQRIIEWFGLEGTIQDTRFQALCHWQGYPPLDQVAQRPIQPGLEHCQGGGIHSYSVQPVPVPHHSHSREFIPNTYVNLDFFSLKPSPLLSSLHSLIKMPSQSFL